MVFLAEFSNLQWKLQCSPQTPDLLLQPSFPYCEISVSATVQIVTNYNILYMQESVDLHRVFTVKKVICKVRIIMYAVWIILWFPWDINVFTIHLAWSVRIVLRFLDSWSKYCFRNMNCLGCLIYRIYNVLYNAQIIVPILHLWVLLLLPH